MNTLIDYIQVLGDTLMVFALWAGAAALVWLHDVVKAWKKRVGENDSGDATSPRPGGETPPRNYDAD